MKALLHKTYEHGPIQDYSVKITTHKYFRPILERVRDYNIGCTQDATGQMGEHQARAEEINAWLEAFDPREVDEDRYFVITTEEAHAAAQALMSKENSQYKREMGLHLQGIVRAEHAFRAGLHEQAVTSEVYERLGYEEVIGTLGRTAIAA